MRPCTYARRDDGLGRAAVRADDVQQHAGPGGQALRVTAGDGPAEEWLTGLAGALFKYHQPRDDEPSGEAGTPGTTRSSR